MIICESVLLHSTAVVSLLRYLKLLQLLNFSRYAPCGEDWICRKRHPLFIVHVLFLHVYADHATLVRYTTENLFTCVYELFDTSNGFYMNSLLFDVSNRPTVFLLRFLQPRIILVSDVIFFRLFFINYLNQFLFFLRGPLAFLNQSFAVICCFLTEPVVRCHLLFFN